MLSAFLQAFRTPDLRRKLLFTLGIIAIYRIGAFVPAVGVSYPNVQQCLGATQQNDLMGMINLFSGGALLQLSVFALGVMPYITASIITQLMRVVIPRFEELHKEGSSGQAKLTQYTRYLTVGLAVLQSAVIVTVANNGLFPGCPVDPIPDTSPVSLLVTVISLTAGTVLIMWFGELITERGVGNGMSLLIFVSIAASFPSAMLTVGRGDGGAGRFALIVGLLLVITLVIVFVEQSQRRIPVQYAKRMVGRRTYGGSSTYIPLKINMANVIPVIFASSILMLPTMASQFGDPNEGWVQWVMVNFSPQSAGYMILMAAMILFFAFFYTSITFNPDEISDNMKRAGGFIPGIRAGRPTAEYLRYVTTRITTVGAIYLTIVALIPTIALAAMNVTQLPFGGTSIIIVVGVGLQTVKEINSQLQQHHYEGFLR
ncbi:preprotein translocase subunit SecY [Georgenia sp. Z1491]|uniref:preprotein translocase subunit SecY n=1 Tax=Georgenia sp. Z1491 TaxID=3416707 RepID=UPI003CFA1237